MTTDVGSGLSGVIATGTRVMWLDPASGSLAYRGRSVESLAGRSSFEEVAYLLITVKGDPTGGSFPVFYFPVTDILLGCVLVLLVGVAAGILPSLQAQRLRIADALRR